MEREIIGVYMINYLIIGLIGSIIMFIGDMLYYYNKEDYDSNNINTLIDLMKKSGKKRIFIGSIIGPFASILYAYGFYSIVLAIKEKYIFFGEISFGLLAIGIILAGFYHGNFLRLALVRDNDKKTLKSLMKFLNYFKLISFSIIAAGLFINLILTITDNTLYSRGTFLFNPLIILLFFPLFRRLPKHYQTIICGGIDNLVFVIYFAVCLTDTLIF